MFDFLEGTIAAKEAMRLVLRVGGPEGAVGYTCRVPLGTAPRLEEKDGLVRLFVLTVVQDECPRLLGFASPEERDLSRLLLRLPGVGPNLVLGLLSAGGPERLLRALRDEDLGFLRAIKGVGPKTARRLCLETKDKAGLWLEALGGGTVPSGDRDPSEDPEIRDAVLALQSLGFQEEEARQRVLAARETEPEAPLETLIKNALRAGIPPSSSVRRAGPRGRRA